MENKKLNLLKRNEVLHAGVSSSFVREESRKEKLRRYSAKYFGLMQAIFEYFPLHAVYRMDANE